ncbi:hypothetical protein ColLi_13992 [Colletotrichum liriopes]|uniref:Uncharacterized protein n=1 Tax=Colletotrichum liriopes TaxID=708192 RepID=A0AA37H196_9PEZI|nr:hypothetical protein ColLi_13992 [Colletotrichum liriopes]
MVRFLAKMPAMSAPSDPSALEASSRPHHQLQPFELCFHKNFVGNATQTISLHFDDGPDSIDADPDDADLGPTPVSISRYPSPLVLATPSPPYAVHEIPDILDLTLPDAALDPVASSRSQLDRRSDEGHASSAYTGPGHRAHFAATLLLRMRVMAAESWLPTAIGDLRLLTLLLGPNAVPASHWRPRSDDDSSVNDADNGGDSNNDMDPGQQNRQRISLVRAYRSLLGHHTNAEATLRPTSESYATLCRPVSTTVLWHFACEPEFTGLAQRNDTQAAVLYLESWAGRTLGQRHKVARHPPVDVDGEALYPDNKHPFHEADDVIDALLPGETDLTALLRHTAELLMGVRDMAGRLSRHAAAAAARGGRGPKPVSPSGGGGLWTWWFPGAAGDRGRKDGASNGGGPRSADVDHEHEWLTKAAADFVSIDSPHHRGRFKALLHGLICASASLSQAGRMADGFRKYLDTLDRERSWISHGVTLTPESDQDLDDDDDDNDDINGHSPPTTERSTPSSTLLITLTCTRLNPGPVREAQAIDEVTRYIASVYYRVQVQQQRSSWLKKSSRHKTSLPPSSVSRLPPPDPQYQAAADEFLQKLQDGILRNEPLHELLTALGSTTAKAEATATAAAATLLAHGVGGGPRG